jgi:hypothetical protein
MILLMDMDPRVIRTGSIFIFLTMAALVAYLIDQRPHGAFGWISIFFFGLVGVLALLGLIVKRHTPRP